MVSTLHRKLLRDLWQLKGQVLTIALVVSAGIAVLLGGISTYNTLEQAQRQYYKSNQFADIFAFLKRAPNKLVDRISEIEGVNVIETRIVYDVTIQVSTMKEPAVARILSIPRYNLPQINRLHLRAGRLLTPNETTNEVLVNEAFAKAHKLKPGNSISAILNGKKKQLRIVGIVLSPEFVYAIRGQDILPDDKHFGVFWMNYQALAHAFAMDGAFNSVAIKTGPGSIPQEIIDKIDILLKPYGGLGAVNNQDQASNRFISNELRQLKFIATIIPTIFMLVAAFLLNIVTGRLVNIQRQQIATLKAIAYSDWKIAAHYVKLITVIVIIGAVIGVPFGAWMGKQMVIIYRDYFYFPKFDYQLSLKVILAGIAISFAAAMSGTIGSLLKVLRLQPAAAMRPQAPRSYRSSIFDRTLLRVIKSPALKMILRYILRFPLRSFYTTIGVALSVAVVMLGLFWKDSIFQIMNLEFMISNRSHAIVTFHEPISQRVLTEISKLTGVLSVEASRTVPVELSSQHYSYKTALVGLQSGDKQRQVLNKRFRRMNIPEQQVLISKELAKRLHVKVGDPLQVEVLQGKRQKFTITISDLVNDYMGLAAYTSLTNLNQRLQEGEVISTATLLIDQNYLHQLYQNLSNIPKVATVQLKSSIMRVFEETFAKHIFTFTAFFTGFAIVIAVGIVYNAARITLAERAWELATLMVLGFTRREVSTLLLGGLSLEVLAGIPIGWLIGYYLASLSIYLIPTEVIRIPFLIETSTLANAAIVTIIASILSAYLVRRKIKHLNLIAALKSFE